VRLFRKKRQKARHDRAPGTYVSCGGRVITVRFPTEPDKPYRNPFLDENGKLRIGTQVKKE